MYVDLPIQVYFFRNSFICLVTHAAQLFSPKKYVIYTFIYSLYICFSKCPKNVQHTSISVDENRLV